jgi:hypothetical protein
MAGCAAWAAGMAAWSTSERVEKNEHYRHEITKKSSRFLQRAENRSVFTQKKIV